MQQICTCMHIRTFVILHPYEKVFTWVLRVTCILKDFILFLAIIRTTWQCIWLIIEGSDVFCPITYVLGLYLDYAAKKQCCNGNNHKLVGSCCLRYVYIAAMALEWVNGHENISVESWSLWKKKQGNLLCVGRSTFCMFVYKVYKDYGDTFRSIRIVPNWIQLIDVIQGYEGAW